jgi:hypothetical protein
MPVRHQKHIKTAGAQIREPRTRTESTAEKYAIAAYLDIYRDKLCGYKKFRREKWKRVSVRSMSL